MASVANPEEHVRTVCLVVIAGILSAAALHWLEKVLVPLVLAILVRLSKSNPPQANGQKYAPYS